MDDPYISIDDNCATIKFGPMAGAKLKPLPYRADSIKNSAHVDIVLAVCAYLIGRVLGEECKYLEVDGYDPETCAWAISAYRISHEIPTLKLAAMIDDFANHKEMRGCIVSTHSNLEQWSRGTFRGEKVRGCLTVLIKNPQNRSSQFTTLLSSVPEDLSSTTRDRSDRYMRSNRTGVGKVKSTKPTRDEVGMAISKKRGLVNRVLDFFGGVSSNDIDTAVNIAYDQNV